MNFTDTGGPVVALHGTFGRGVTFAALTEHLAPDSRVIHREAPDACAQAVRGFFGAAATTTS